MAKKEYEEYKPYKPSGVPGALGIGALVGGAAYLGRRRIPFLRELLKVSRSTAPKPPLQSQVPKPLDKINETIATAQTPTAQSMELISKTPPAVKHANDYRATLDLVQANSIKLPLSQGSGKGRFGSSLYDWIAQHPSMKPLPAKVWADQFKKGQTMANFKSNQPGFQNIRMNVSRRELEDANIAVFGPKDELIGGFLKTAEQANMNVAKTDLLKMVINSPAVNLRVKRFEYVNDAPQLVEPIVIDAQRLLRKFYDKISIQQAPAGYGAGTTGKAADFFSKKENTLNQLQSRMDDLQLNMAHINANARQNFPSVDYIKSNVDDVAKQIGKVKELLPKIESEINAAGLAPIKGVDEAMDLQRKILTVQRKLAAETKLGQSPKYGVGENKTYAMHGDQKYIEDVIYYPKTIPYGRNVPAQHYDELVNGTKLENQIYHARYGLRTVSGPERNRAYVLHEAQSDVHQKAYDAMKRYPNKKRTNPFNTEAEFGQASAALDNIWNKMKVIYNKPMPTYADRMELRRLRELGEELRKNTVNASNIATKVSNRSDNTIPFLPMIERDVWGDHLIKHLAKSAADDGVKWIAIHPVERLHAFKRADKQAGAIGKLGDFEFYGTATGKAGLPGVKAFSKKQNKAISTPYNKTAVLPERMIKLAKQYNSEARPIMISKSDPDLPWKIVQSHSARAGTDARMLGFRKPIDEHLIAFKTEAEAQYYLKEIMGSKTNIKILKLEANDPRLYSEAFGLKITPDMLEKPFKLYKKEGGLVVDLFKW
jgi:uncharacterized protein (DUF1684 family)